MRERTVAMIAEQRAALLSSLGDAAGDDWARPTRCTGWTAKDVLAHLVEGELNVGRLYRSEVSELGFIDPEEGIARWAALPGEAVRSAYWQHGRATQRVLESLDDGRWRAPIRAFGCSTIGQLARLHLFEALIHGSDLTEALGADAVWDDRIGFAVEFVVRAAPATLARRGIQPRGRVVIDVGARSAVLEAHERRWTVRLDAGDAPGADMLELSPTDLVLVTTGRVPVDAVLARARIAGDAGELRRVLEGWQVLA